MKILNFITQEDVDMLGSGRTVGPRFQGLGCDAPTRLPGLGHVKSVALGGRHALVLVE